MSKRKLLLADDSITIQKVVNLTFADEGIEVFTFDNGDSALIGIEDLKPDIVLADVNMPGLNGYQLCESIRGNDHTTNVPVVLLVGSFEPFDDVEADRVGATSYLTKPFSSIADLIATVKNLLDSTLSLNGIIDKPGTPETDDINHLYEQSFIQTVEFEPGENLGGEFGDDSGDDEMIQTSYAEPPPDSASAADFVHFTEIDEITPAHESTEAESAEVTLEDHTEIGEPVLQLSDNDDVPDRGLKSAPDLTEIPNDDDRNSENRKVQFQLDDFDLLELPEIPRGKSYEFTTPDLAGNAKSPTQVVSLSPELIEIIAQKVVDKMAEKY